jgi:type III secretory pathway component EscS
MFPELEHALYLSILLSAFPLAVIALVGLVIAILQAATQIQEQTVTYVVKVVTFGALLFLGGGWMMEELLTLFRTSFEALATAGSFRG